MKLRRTTPEIYKVPLHDCSTDIAFRFPDSADYAYMRLPYDGADIHAIYKGQTGSAVQATANIIDDLSMHNENLYCTDASDEIDVKWVEENLEKFWAYVSLTTGIILLTHRDELVIPLNAELIIEDTRI